LPSLQARAIGLGKEFSSAILHPVQPIDRVKALLHRINPKPIEAAERAYRIGYGRAIGIPENGGIALEGSRRP